MNTYEPPIATAGTGMAFAADMADANGWLQFAIGALTLAWWVRIWIKSPNCSPPPK